MSGTRLALHVFATFGKGGPQVRAAQVLAHMGPGWRHRIIAMDDNTQAAVLLPAEIGVEFAPAPANLGFLASMRVFAQRLRQDQPDLLLTYNWGAIEAVAGARRAGFGRVVHHEDGFGREEWHRRLRRRNWVRRIVLGKVPAIVVPSRKLATIASAEWRLRPDRLHHLVNGVDCQRFRPAAAGSAPRAFTVGTVGGLRAEKDHATLLRGLAAMRDRQAGAVLVGDGPERQRLQALAGELGLGDRASFTGATDDPAPYYREMDAFVLSSRTEQMPLSLLEAMATGLPVASTDVGDVADILPEGSRGAIVEPGDPAALAGALEALAADADRRHREGQANRQRCLDDFELTASLDRFAAVYEQVADSPSAAVGSGR